jgi:electron transfer flavoprotein beta subunit
MKILVLVKQVCDGADTLSPDPSAQWVSYGSSTVFRMNRYDEYAVEEALRIRERFPGTEIHAISLGPERVQSTIRRAMGMGADHGIHVTMEEQGYAGPRERAGSISRVAGERGYDLILAGIMAEDDMEGQVGGLVAQMLGFSCATGVMLQEISPDMGEVKVEREIEGGCRECLTIGLPAVLTVQSGINVPRYPALSHTLRARTAVLEEIEATPPCAGTLSGITLAERGPTGEFIEGTPQEKARRLLELLHDNSLL